MKSYIILLLFVYINTAHASNFPKPLLYVVTPSPKISSVNEGRSAPFYYHNWMRRMDAPENITTTFPPKVKTPDLIFAEFESDSGDNMKKSIRKLLEKERIEAKTTTTTTTTTTSRPIYVPNEEYSDRGVHKTEIIEKNKQDTSGISDYYSLYNNQYNDAPGPVYLPLTTQSTTRLTTVSPSTTPAPMDLENIWHIIDNEKREQYSGNWKEVPINFEKDHNIAEETNIQNINIDSGNGDLDENFALPGFGTSHGSGAENESRAIRTEPTRFPYVSLKPFQMKKPLLNLNVLSNSKKGTNMLTSLDNFHDVKNPLRGEAQDIYMRQPNFIDRYNPAQPYLPSKYGSTSKQSSSNVHNTNQALGSLVPPPPPPSQVNGDDFSIPNNYESFPPYPPSISNSRPALTQPSVIPSFSEYQPPSSAFDDSTSDSSPDNNDDESPIDLGQLRPPSPPVENFIPTVPSVSKPFGGYSYGKPMTIDTPPTKDDGGYSYSKPAKTFDTPPAMNAEMDGYSYSKPESPVSNDTPDFQGYHYAKPKPASPSHNHPSEYPVNQDYDGQHDDATHDHESDYPELIFDKPHGDMHDTKQVDDSKDMGMMPPPPPPAEADMKPDMDAGPPDDNGFPHDFPGDFKYHDFDDHDFHHYHHHHTTTTTTTTEMPRVNRYSYYYLGKKLYYLPLYFSVYFIVYVGALVIKAILRHKIVYPNSWRPNDQTASYFSKRSIDYWDLSHNNLHEVTGRVTKAIGDAAEKYMSVGKVK